VYIRSIFGESRSAWFIAGVLAILYAYLYILMQLEDYALLVGSIGLFVGLAILMFVTRRFDWYSD
jgi:inner membrane protein